MTHALADVKPIRPRVTTARKPATRRPAETAAQRKLREASEARTRAIMRRVGIVGTAAVWINALWISYFHITELMVRHGQSQASAHQYPIIVDGLMLIASVAIVAYPQAILPRVIFLLGAFATVAGNILSVNDGGIIGYMGAGFTGASLICSAYLLERLCMPHKPRARKK
ncbi:MAG TPA: DUF2637 domain-containing protein [Candidatus Paceibacterota bacterium]